MAARVHACGRLTLSPGRRSSSAAIRSAMLRTGRVSMPTCGERRCVQTPVRHARALAAGNAGCKQACGSRRNAHAGLATCSHDDVADDQVAKHVTERGPQAGRRGRAARRHLQDQHALGAQLRQHLWREGMTATRHACSLARMLARASALARAQPARARAHLLRRQRDAQAGPAHAAVLENLCHESLDHVDRHGKANAAERALRPVGSGAWSVHQR